MRNAAERRHNDWREAVRKRRIVREVYRYPESEEWYSNLHEYSKGKVHCSCGMCSRYRKTNNRGRRRRIQGNYAPSRNWSIRDQKRILEMEEEEMEEE